MGLASQPGRVHRLRGPRRQKVLHPDAIKLKRPHPNCKCTLQPVKATASNTRKVNNGREQNHLHSVSMGSDTVGIKDAGKLLHELYGPKEKDYWHSTPMETWLGYESPFLVKGLQKKVRRTLKQKAIDYEDCSNWSTQFKAMAESYSYWDAFIDGYRYGSNAHSKVIHRIENNITASDCDSNN